VYVLLGSFDSEKPVRYFIAKNGVLAKHVHCPKDWKQYGFVPMKAVERYENRWDLLPK
jgi:hypothetical protein